MLYISQKREIGLKFKKKIKNKKFIVFFLFFK